MLKDVSQIISSEKLKSGEKQQNQEEEFQTLSY